MSEDFQSVFFSRGTFNMMRGIIKTEGVTGLYRGLPGIWIKDIPGSFLYFGSYELAKSTIRHFKQIQQLGKFPFIPVPLLFVPSKETCTKNDRVLCKVQDHPQSISDPVTDPGFSKGWHQPIVRPKFPENYMKMKKVWPRGKARPKFVYVREHLLSKGSLFLLAVDVLMQSEVVHVLVIFPGCRFEGRVSVWYLRRVVLLHHAPTGGRQDSGAGHVGRRQTQGLHILSRSHCQIWRWAFTASLRCSTSDDPKVLWALPSIQTRGEQKCISVECQPPAFRQSIL